MIKKIQASGFPIILTILFILLSLGGYIGMAWWVDRSDYRSFALFLTAVFAGYAFWWFNRSLFSWRTILIFAVLFRALFLFDGTTRLSNDVYRFIWDAEQVSAGENPYLYTPEELSAQNPNTIFDTSGPLYQHLNSTNYFSVYPPVCQFVWGLSSWLADVAGVGDSISHRIIFLKSIYLIFEIITMLLLVNILIKRGMAGQLAGIYALNPLIIIELTGNLHPEAIMILFLILASILALSNRIALAAIPFGFAVSTKFIPVLFIPFLIKRYGWKNTFIFGSISLGVAMLLFIPFLTPELVAHVGKSLGLYFTNFEFNASIYFIVRNIFELITGHNLIEKIGPILALSAFAAIVYVFIKQKSTISALLIVYFIYIISATTVHPWYLALPIVLAVYSNHRWPLIASGAVMASYFLYSFGFENWWIITSEYMVIVTAFIIDLYRPRQKQPKLSTTW
jgi:hypothetical protein